ncbi:hypothetical protein [Mesorhizobium sp. B4-1-4]|nr:hypothetical protein [Mesorhizobium sp. B4-1-4]UCI30170.1 hypothetical protein FJW03_20445 [Mesorhizobium sp. B4-1-4]
MLGEMERRPGSLELEQALEQFRQKCMAVAGLREKRLERVKNAEPF